MTEQQKFLNEHNRWARSHGGVRLIRSPGRKRESKPRPRGAFPSHNLTAAQREEIRQRHPGICEICGIKPEKKMAVDHCHATGKIRGLLCNSCNSLLGFCADNKARLTAAIAYLDKYGTV